jgi:hypothetical protein
MNKNRLCDLYIPVGLYFPHLLLRSHEESFIGVLKKASQQVSTSINLDSCFQGVTSWKFSKQLTECFRCSSQPFQANTGVVF